MPLKFRIEKRKVFEREYLKVYLLDSTQLEMVKSLLDSFPVVHNCNITHNTTDDLTIYPSGFYSIDEAKEEIRNLLAGFFEGKLLQENTKRQSVTIQSAISSYPDALKLYSKAIEGINNGGDYRHALDDLRLSLETLLKHLLNNNKSIENQDSKIIGLYLGKKGISTEIISNVHTNLQGIAKYFNEHEKHNDKVKTNEIDYIVNTVNNIIKIMMQ